MSSAKNRRAAHTLWDSLHIVVPEAGSNPHGCLNPEDFKSPTSAIPSLRPIRLLL